MPDTDRWAALREAAAKATPGPWHLCAHLKSIEHDRACSCGYRGSIWGGDQEHVVCQPGHDGAPAGQEGTEPQRYEREQEIANAHYIAAAHPSAIADLLAERDRLAAELAEANADNEELLRELPSLREQITQTQAGFVAENARLRAALALAREAIAGMPASLGYEYTHLRAIDAALRGDAA